LAVLLTGDGGWAKIDRALGSAFAEAGIPTVGLISPKYFWRERTPDEVAIDLERILRYYLAEWGKKKILLVGFSQGADVLPFAVNRLPSELKSRIKLVALLSASREAVFEYHVVASFLDRRPATGTLPILPEVGKMEGIPILCLYGEDEKKSLCPLLKAPMAECIALPGGHHFDGNYRAMAATILRAAK
jgi:type IV secretory pathway VirJ component